MADKKNVAGGPLSDEVFDSLPFISIEDGLKSRTGRPAPIDPDIKAAQDAMDEAEVFGTISLDEMKKKLGLGTRTGNGAECQRPRRDRGTR